MLRVAVAALLVASCTASNPDYFPAVTGCTLGERTCTGSHPAVCGPNGDGGTMLVAAPCPPDGTCQAGRCTPPSPRTPCQRDRDCGLDRICTAFVDPTNGGIATFCAAPAGPVLGGVACTTAQQCRSALCLMGNRSLCYQACAGDGDCATIRCRRFSVTITGVQGTIQGCGPP